MHLDSATATCAEDANSKKKAGRIISFVGIPFSYDYL